MVVRDGAQMANLEIYRMRAPLRRQGELVGMAWGGGDTI